VEDIYFECPACRKSHVIDDRGAGSTIKCVNCGIPITVPNSTPVVADPAPNASNTCPQCGAVVETSGALCLSCLVAKTAKLQEVREKERLLTIKKAQAAAEQLSTPIPAQNSPPSRKQVSFACPHCGTSLQGFSCPGETVQCLTCGGSVIVPEGADQAARHLGEGILLLLLSSPLWLLMVVCAVLTEMSVIGRIVMATIFAALAMPLTIWAVSKFMGRPPPLRFVLSILGGAAVVVVALSLAAKMKSGTQVLGGGSASISVEYAEPYIRDLTGCFSFGNWEKEPWGYSGTMTFHGWKTMGGHPTTVAVEFESLSSSGVVLGRGKASFPDLLKGQSGKIELAGHGADEAARIHLLVGGAD